MAKMNIKKGDKVKVLAGKDRGAVSTVIRAFPAQQRVMVEKVNMVTKAQHPTQQNPQGGLIKLEAPIHVSNVQLVCPKCNEATRVNNKRVDKKKIRVCKKCGADID